MSSSSTRRLYEVARGVKYDEESFRRKFDDLVVSVNQQDLLTLAREVERDGRAHYGGVFRSNQFRVNSRILIHGLGFFGPAVETQGAYQVDVDIYEATKHDRLPNAASRRIAVLRQNVVARRGEIYFVNFKMPVSITPGLWYDIKFCLEGPDTAHCETTFTSAKVPTAIGELRFDFYDGSRQMPKIIFGIL